MSGFLKTPTATVRGLETGTEYEFRVRAENAMGVGEPLETEQAIKAKHPYGNWQSYHHALRHTLLWLNQRYIFRTAIGHGRSSCGNNHGGFCVPNLGPPAHRTGHALRRAEATQGLT